MVTDDPTGYEWLNMTGQTHRFPLVGVYIIPINSPTSRTDSELSAHDFFFSWAHGSGPEDRCGPTRVPTLLTTAFDRLLSDT